MRSDIPSKQARKVSRILRPFVVIYDRESDRMHTLASPLRGSSHPFTPRRDRDRDSQTPKEKVLCTICCPTIFQPLGKKYKTLFPFLLATMLMSAKAVHCSFFCAFRLSLSKNAYDDNSLLPLQKILLRRLIRGISRFPPLLLLYLMHSNCNNGIAHPRLSPSGGSCASRFFIR